jgi:hypothetical protein
MPELARNGACRYDSGQLSSREAANETRTLDSSIDISVIEDDEWRVASRLDGNPNNQLGKGSIEKARTTNFFNVPAAYLYSILATGVLPVKDTFLTAGFSHSSRPTSEMLVCVVTTLITPDGMPARVAN